jgi:hypothetical protein
MRHQLKICGTLLLSLLAAKPALSDGTREKSGRYVRLQSDQQQQPVALETAVVRFQDTSRGVTVDLIGAIHIADKAYYEALNRRFQTYDAVLYELVAREGANVPSAGQGSGGVIGGMQVGMKSILDLAYQLDCIDYRRKNMVHADMSPEEFAATMKRRNETFTGMFFRMLGRALAEQAEDPLVTSDWELLAALFAPDRAHRLKVIMARQFADMEDQIGVFDGPDGSTIITERNGKALEVLKREIRAGHKKLAIFYGAGHLPDLQQRLETQFDMQSTGTEWLPAWSLKSEKRAKE